MSITYSQARDELNKLVTDAWQAGSTAVCGYVPKVFYQGVIDPELPPKDKYWARVSVTTVDSWQSAMGIGTHTPSKQRYREIGIVAIQIFGPANTGNAFEVAGKLAEMIRNAFRGTTTPGCIWFRNARIIPLSMDGGFERFNVVTDFQYDEIH